jgi:diketogulonate reductase-like aldo/keto reductase
MKVSVCPSSLIHGGGMIDSSPMYGRAEWLLGQLLPDMPHRDRVLAATKIWTPFDKLGPSQIEDSLKLWGLPRLDVVLGSRPEGGGNRQGARPVCGRPRG